MINKKLQSLRSIKPTHNLFAMEVEGYDLIVGKIYPFCDHGLPFIDGPMLVTPADFLVEMRYLGSVNRERIEPEIEKYLEQDGITKLYKFYNSETVRGAAGGISLVRTAYGLADDVFHSLLFENGFGVKNPYGENRPEISTDTQWIEDDLKRQSAWEKAQARINSGTLLLFEKVTTEDVYPFESQADNDFYFGIMDEHYQEEVKMQQLYKSQSDRIMDVLAKIKSSEWMQELKDYCIEAGAYNPFKIVRKPKGHYQEELEFPEFGGVWVDQYTGHEPDDYYGTIAIKIDEKRWLELPYHC